MPGADDRVVLQIKLELKQLKDQFKATIGDIKKLDKELDRLAATGKKGFEAQKKIMDDVAKATLRAGKAAKESQRAVQEGLRKTNEELKKQERLINKIGGALKKMRPTQVRAGMGQMAAGVGGFLMGGIQQGYQGFLQRGAAEFGLAGMGNRAQFRQGLRAVGGPTSRQLGWSRTETIQQAAAVGRATGNIGAVRTAQQAAAAAGGMDVGEMAGFMGTLRGAGVRFGLGRAATSPEEVKKAQQLQASGKKQVQDMIAAGMATGIEKARLPQMLEGMGQAIQEAGLRTAGDVDLKAIGKSVNLMSKLFSQDRTKVDPRRMMAFANRVDQAIRSPGGGPAGDAFVKQALGFGKPGGTVGYYDVLKRQQAGAFGATGAENVLDLMMEARRQFAPGAKAGTQQMQGANLVLSKVLGDMPLEVIEGIQKNFDKMTGGATEMDEKTRQRILDDIKSQIKSQVPIDKQALEVAKSGFAGVKIHLASMDDKSTSMGKVVGQGFMDIQSALMEIMLELTPVMKILAEGISNLAGAVIWVKDWLKDKWGSSDRMKKEQAAAQQKAAAQAKKDEVKYLKERGMSATGLGGARSLREMGMVVAARKEALAKEQQALVGAGINADEVLGEKKTRLEKQQSFVQDLRRAMVAGGVDPKKKFSAEMASKLTSHLATDFQSPQGRQSAINQMVKAMGGTPDKAAKEAEEARKKLTGEGKRKTDRKEAVDMGQKLSSLQANSISVTIKGAAISNLGGDVHINAQQPASLVS